VSALGSDAFLHARNGCQIYIIYQRIVKSIRWQGISQFNFIPSGNLGGIKRVLTQDQPFSSPLVYCIQKRESRLEKKKKS
jgi:hypothetical protein